MSDEGDRDLQKGIMRDAIICTFRNITGQLVATEDACAMDNVAQLRFRRQL